MTRLRKTTRCRIPGHGDKCEVSTEQSNYYTRVTEEHLAMAYEEAGWADSSEPTVAKLDTYSRVYTDKTMTKETYMAELTFETVDVTPEIAAEYLGHNTRNRNIRLRDVAGYARDMVAEEWDFTAEPIKFDWDGVLIDGQHRLLAVVESGKTVRFLVARGLDPKVQDAVDTGVKRKFHDQLRLKGYHNVAQMASITRLVWMWENGVRKFSSNNIKPTNPQLWNTLTDNPQLVDISKEATQVAQKCGLPASIAGCAMYLFDAIDSEDCEAFFERLTSAVGHTHNEPIYELRRTLEDTVSVRGERDRTWVFAVTVKAWNAYRSGDTVHHYKFHQGGAKPEKFPMPR